LTHHRQFIENEKITNLKWRIHMNKIKLLLVMLLGISLAACGSGSSTATAPGTPTAVSVAPGATAGTAKISFTAPASSGSSAITGYTVTANPGGITATGAASPITLTGLTPQAAYTYSVVATNSTGSSAATTTGNLTFYKVVETFSEPMTQPNDTIFTGTFAYDSTNKTVSNLSGSLTQAMTKVGGVYGTPMTTVALVNQLSSVPAALGGVDGLLVTSFALTTTDTFDLGGFAPGGTQYFGLTAGTPNNHNAYAMIFVNTTDPTTVPAQAQIDKMAYADCTAGGMMMTSCMTGTTVAGYGKKGTMSGVPVSQVITKQ
jgi:hypothetical protein